MSREIPIFVYRPLEEHSVERVKQLQAKYSLIPSFNPVTDLHTTVVSGNSGPLADRYQLEAVMKNAPSTAIESHTALISEILLNRSKDVTRIAIQLALDETNSQRFLDERALFKQRFQNVRGGAFIRHLSRPHVTVGYVGASLATGSLVEQASEVVGAQLDYGPVDSTFGPAQVRPKQEKRPIVRKDYPIDHPVAYVRPGGIPTAFLASLRTSESSE